MKKETIINRGAILAWFLCGLLLPAIMPAEVSAGEELVLVDKGRSLVPVVIFSNAPPYTRRAADELAVYIEKTGGAKPAVIEGLPDPVPEHAIWVGYQPKLKELFPKVDFEFKHPEEILIACDGKNLAILGKDRWDTNHLVVVTRRGTVEGKQFEYGTINAVYTFLQKYLDVRWLWPGELGEDIVPKKKIAFEPFEYRYHPQFRHRGGLFRLSALGDNRGHSFDWARQQRLQLDSLFVDCSHAYTDWWDKYFTNHPDYFALQPDGTRSGFPAPTEPAKAKICQANPAVWTQWLDNVAAVLQSNVYQTMFSASPNDSYNRGHCICEKCRAWDNPDGEMLVYTWQGLSQEYVALSDRQVNFANTLGKLMKERFPGRELYVGMHAYGHYRAPPIKAVPDDNVFISSVANMFLVNRESRDLHKKYFKGWADKTRNIMCRPNVGGYNELGLPVNALQNTIEDFRFLADNHCAGLYVDTIWEHWATHGPLYYAMAQMAWDPGQDGKEMMEDYYRRGFGPAAGQVREYWELLEKAHADFTERGSTLGRKDSRNPALQEAYNEELMKKADELLKKAVTRAGDTNGVYRQRVDFVRAGFDFTRLMVRNMDLAEKARQSQGADKEAITEARANWEQIKKICDDYPLAFNYNFMIGRATELGLLKDIGIDMKKKKGKTKK
jgi:hypothetical protein